MHDAGQGEVVGRLADSRREFHRLIDQGLSPCSAGVDATPPLLRVKLGRWPVTALRRAGRVEASVGLAVHSDALVTPGSALHSLMSMSAVDI